MKKNFRVNSAFAQLWPCCRMWFGPGRFPCLTVPGVRSQYLKTMSCFPLVGCQNSDSRGEVIWGLGKWLVVKTGKLFDLSMDICLAILISFFQFCFRLRSTLKQSLREVELDGMALCFCDPLWRWQRKASKLYIKGCDDQWLLVVKLNPDFGQGSCKYACYNTSQVLIIVDM